MISSVHIYGATGKLMAKFIMMMHRGDNTKVSKKEIERYLVEEKRRATFFFAFSYKRRYKNDKTC